MTVNELVEKLEQVRNFIEGSDDDNVRQAFDDVNELISDLEQDGIDSNDGFRKVLLNAILWTAGMEVPQKGFDSPRPDALEILKNLDLKKKNK